MRKIIFNEPTCCLGDSILGESMLNTESRGQSVVQSATQNSHVVTLPKCQFHLSWVPVIYCLCFCHTRGYIIKRSSGLHPKKKKREMWMWSFVDIDIGGNKNQGNVCVRVRCDSYARISCWIITIYCFMLQTQFPPQFLSSWSIVFLVELYPS